MTTNDTNPPVPQRPMNAQELREQADRLDREAAVTRKGLVLISQWSGMACIHDGSSTDERTFVEYRQASEAEVQALCTIPEFQAHLSRVRGS